MRANGTGIPLNKTIRPGEVVPREPDKDERIIRAEKKRDNWRMRHNEFIKTIRSAKAYQSAVSKGGNAPLPPPPPSAIDPDLVKCPYCNRRFNETAAERHIPFCKDKSERDRLKLQSNKTPKRPNTRSSSVQKLSPIHSASAHRDTKSRSRYSDFNPERLLNKSCLNGLAPEMEDICNSTFDLGDTLNPEISTKSTHDSGDNEEFSVSHPKPSSESNFQRSKIYRTVSPRKVSLNYTKNNSTLHNISPDTIEHEEIFQNEQQFHKYLEDQAYVLDQTEFPLPTRTISKPSFLSKCIQTLKQTSLMSSYDAGNSRMENNLGNYIALQNEIDYDRVDHNGNREEISDIFSKFGKVNRRRMAAQQSGILVRAVNVSARREPLAVQQTSQTRVSSKILHCHECGAKYPTTSARFCPECGVKKMAI
ncbi:unnamed protein product [Hymenolepis diminuta]|uniref:Zinc finger C2HC domain-containing protein 1B n=1 Tax=Hymenolepis diminuta TaxID=6216 RepID=A0A158QDX3_HYMDI|nr:unnamed protein product [Hymenolepis diminuta]